MITAADSGRVSSRTHQGESPGPGAHHHHQRRQRRDIATAWANRRGGSVRGGVRGRGPALRRRRRVHRRERRRTFGYRRVRGRRGDRRADRGVRRPSDRPYRLPRWHLQRVPRHRRQQDPGRLAQPLLLPRSAGLHHVADPARTRPQPVGGRRQLPADRQRRPRRAGSARLQHGRRPIPGRRLRRGGQAGRHRLRRRGLPPGRRGALRLRLDVPRRTAAGRRPAERTKRKRATWSGPRPSA